MKIADGLKLIENGWIRKPKGFRVRFHRQTDAGVEAGLSPPPEAAPLNSDVTAWRYASPYPPFLTLPGGVCAISVVDI